MTTDNTTGKVRGTPPLSKYQKLFRSRIRPDLLKAPTPPPITQPPPLDKRADRGLWEAVAPPPSPLEAELPPEDEGFLANLWDSFRLGATQLAHRTKQYFNTALPGQMFGDFQADLKVFQAENLLQDGRVDSSYYQQLLANAERLRETNKATRDTFKKKYIEAEGRNIKWLKAHPELEPPKVLEQGIFEAIKKDPKVLLNRAALGYIIGESAAFSIAFFGTVAGVTALTKNPFAGAATAVGIATPAVSQDLYEDLIASGATDEQAAELSPPIGTLISSIEIVGAIPLLGAISKPFRNILMRNMRREVAKATIAGLTQKGLITFSQVQVAEILEEITQGAIQDATVRTFDENRDLLENIPETVIRTAIATLPFAVIGAGGRVRMERGIPVEPVAVKPAVRPSVTPSVAVVAGARAELVPEKPIKVGDTVTDKQGRKWKVLDTSDPSLLTVESEAGIEGQVGLPEVTPPVTPEVKPPTKATQTSIGRVNQAVKNIEELAPKEQVRESQIRRRQLVSAYESLEIHARKLGVPIPKLGTFYNPEQYLNNARQMQQSVERSYGVTQPTPEAVTPEVGAEAEQLWRKRAPIARSLESFPDEPTRLARIGKIEIELAKLGELPISQAEANITFARKSWEERYSKAPEMESVITSAEKALKEFQAKPPAVEEIPIETPPAKPPVNIKKIQEQGRTNPESVSKEDAKLAHTELAAPDGPRKPPPTTPKAKARESDDILRELADKTPLGERPDQALLRLYEAAINSLQRRTNSIITKGDQKLKTKGIGVVKRGQLVPKEKDKAILTELYNALHNPSKVVTGEIAVPAGYEAIYKELRELANWTTAARLDFDPNAATLDDWFFRGWKPPEGMFEVQKGKLGVKPKALRMPRVDATFEELIELGFEPLFWNPYQQWGYRHKLGEVYREQMELITYLKAMGNEFVRPDSGGALPVGWKIPRIGPAFEGKPFATTVDGEPTVMFTRRWVTPTKIANTLENIFGRRPDIGKFFIGKKEIDPLSIIDFLTFVPKRAKLLFSLFQQVDFLTRAGGGSWAGMVDNLMAGKPIAAVKALAIYPKTVAEIIQANFVPGKRLSIAKQLDDTTPLIQGRPGVHLKGISEAGLSTIDITIFAKDMDKIMRTVADNTGIWGKAKGVADSFIDLESAMRRGLFSGVYPAAMITDIKNNLAIMMVRDNPNATDAQINAVIAKEVNKKYSTIPPSQSVFQNTVAREVLRRIFFSVGESEGLLRQASSMFHGQHKRFWTRNNLGVALFVLAVANIIHFLSTGEPLPKERYVPISKNSWGPLPFGYNTKFAAPTLPWRGRGDVELTLDLMGQMDTALRVLDPGSFISARASVPIRATINQVSGTDFYGAPIDDVGPGGVASRLSQLVFDLFSPIGVGQIGAAVLREAIPGELIPRGEERVGMMGLGIQATGLNIRAEGTKVLLDRHARESGLPIYPLKADGAKVQSWADLEPHQWGKVLDNLKLVEEMELRSIISAERGYPGAAGFFTLQELEKQRIDRGEGLVREFNAGEYEKGEFPKEVSKLKAEIAIRKSQVNEDFQLFQDTQELPQDPNKRALVEYYSIFEKAKRESGTIDWDMVEIWEYGYRIYWTPEQEAYVDRNTGLTKWGPLMQKYIDAQKALSDSGYWDIQEPKQDKKRKQLRRANPEIEAILVKWYGYEPLRGTGQVVPPITPPSRYQKMLRERIKVK